MTDWSLTLSAPAKINLYLGVHTERDDRGYHKVDSLMAAVGLVDTVTVTPAQALTVQTIPASDFPMQKNTAYRAATAMAEHYGREANVCITIEKRIPLCAGLGGPSTDAAAVIVALAESWGIDRADPALDNIARGIGADVPFFLHASPAFYVGGGDVLATEYPALPATPVVLVKPREASVSTIEAYRRFDETQRLRTSPERSHLPFARETQRRPTRSSTTTWVSFPRRWSRGFKRCSTGFVHRTVPLPQTCAVRVPARLLSAILPPRQSILRQPLNKTAGGLMQRSSFPTRFALKRQRSKNFSGTRRKSLLL